MYGGKQRKLPSLPAASSKAYPNLGRSRVPVLHRNASQEKLENVSGISTVLKRDSTSPEAQNTIVKAPNGGRGKHPLVKARSREFIDVVKHFEGGTVPERILKSVEEKNQLREEQRIRDCEQELWQIRRRLEETEEDYKTMRLATKRIKFHLSEVHSLKTIMSFPIRR